LFYGNPAQFFIQLASAAVTIVFAFGVTYLVAWALKRWLGLRVTENEEEVGLDISEHGERAYA
jgi:Amt family ammonium transporter